MGDDHSWARGAWTWLVIWGALLLGGPLAWAAAPPALTLFPLAAGEPALAGGAADLVIKGALLASLRYRVDEEPAPEGYDVACVRSFFCLKRLAAAHPTDRMIAGVIEREGSQLKVYLVLFDSARGSTLKVVESRMPPETLGQRLPELVASLVADEPAFPPEAFPKEAPRPKPRPVAAVSKAGGASERDLEEEARRDRVASAAGGDDLAWDDLSRADPETGPEVSVGLGVRTGGARLAGYTLIASGVDVSVRLRRQIVVGLTVDELNGYDAPLNTSFFLLGATASGDWLFRRQALHPYAGVEARVVTLAPGLPATGGAARGGVWLDLTDTIAFRGHTSLGVVANRYLPETVFQLARVQVVGTVQAQVVFKLR